MTQDSVDAKLKDWQVPYKCRKCGDIIYSRYQGEYRSCKCGAIAVDQTAHYARGIGEWGDFIEIDT